MPLDDKRVRIECMISNNFTIACALLQKWLLDPDKITDRDLNTIIRMAMETTSTLKHASNNIIISHEHFNKLTQKISQLYDACKQTADELAIEDLIHYICAAEIIIAVHFCETYDQLILINDFVVKEVTDLSVVYISTISAFISEKLQHNSEANILCMTTDERDKYIADLHSLSRNFAIMTQDIVTAATPVEYASFTSITLHSLVQTYFSTLTEIQTAKNNATFDTNISLKINRAELLFAHLIQRIDGYMRRCIIATYSLEDISLMQNECRGLFVLFIETTNLQINPNKILKICELLCNYFTIVLTFVQKELHPQTPKTITFANTIIFSQKPHIDATVLNNHLRSLCEQLASFGKLDRITAVDAPLQQFMHSLQTFVLHGLDLLSAIKTQAIKTFRFELLIAKIEPLINSFVQINTTAQLLPHLKFRYSHNDVIHIIDQILLTCLKDILLTYSYNNVTGTQFEAILTILDPLKSIFQGHHLKIYLSLLKTLEEEFLHFVAALDDKFPSINSTETPPHVISALQYWCEMRSLEQNKLLNATLYKSQHEESTRIMYSTVQADGLLHDGQIAADVTAIVQYYSDSLDYAETVLNKNSSRLLA